MRRPQLPRSLIMEHLCFDFVAFFMTYSRRTLIAAAASIALGSLTGCGFRLRGHFSLPFKTIYLDMDRNNPFTAQVKRLLTAGSDVTVVPAADEAEAVLRIISRRLERNAITYNADGNVREYELKLTIQFRLTTPTGAEYLPDSSLTAVRDIYYNDEDYLSRGSEEALLIKDMENDIASQMIRRIEKAHALTETPETETTSGLVPER